LPSPELEAHAHVEEQRPTAPSRLRGALARADVWLILSWLGLLASVLFVARHGTDTGVTFDEVFQRRYGEKVMAWFRSGFTDDSAMRYKNLRYYGGLFDLSGQWLDEHSSLGPYETRHMLTAFVALLGGVGAWKLAAAVAGPRAGFFAALMLAFTPAWLGHGLFNPKDIPFGTAAVWAAHGALELGIGPMPLRARDVLWAGFTLGIALAVRPGGIVLLGYPVLAAGARYTLELVWRRRERRTLGAAGLGLRCALQLSFVYALAWLLMLSTWPWAQRGPLERPIEAIRAAFEFHWNGFVLFRGEFIHAHDLPRSYLPVWFAITLPETYLVALVCAAASLVGLHRKRVPSTRALGVLLIAVAAFLPLALAIALRPVVYDGQRHFLFVLPPLAAVAGVALAGALGRQAYALWLRGAVLAVWLGLLAWTARDMYRLHPYEYVYFNRLSGGLRHAYTRYETDYWGATYKEGIDWVVHNVPPVAEGRRTRVSSCSTNTDERMAYYVDRWPGASDQFQVVRGYKRADIYVAMTRDHCAEVPGEVLHVVKRQGVPLLFVFRAEH
jgi:hypothetical protein